MKKVLTVNIPEGKDDSMFTRYLNAQTDLSLAMGWDINDIILITNSKEFRDNFQGPNAIITKLNDFCLTGSKQFALRELLKADPPEQIWAHDLDMWQNTQITFPDIKDIAFCVYSQTYYNGGSVFLKPSAADIVDDITSTIEREKAPREEPVINRLLRSTKYSERVTKLQYTYNVGGSHFIKRYTQSDKPVKCHHFHPEKADSWDTHARNRYNINKTAVIGPVLREVVLNHFGDIISKFRYADGLSPFEVKD